MALVLAASAAHAQEEEGARKRSRIIDDSTKQVYGPTTSRYYYEEDVFYNRERFHVMDTLIKNFHRYSYTESNAYLYQDLGVIGTSLRPIFYHSPNTIGARSGMDTYQLIWDTEEVRYFDTKSPYSNMHVILGGGGRSMTRVNFSRNINPRWNFGMVYRGLFIDKQIQRRNKGDRVARGIYYHFYTAYQNKDSTYRLMANIRRNYHQVDEFGGVRFTTDDEIQLEDYFRNNIQPNLISAESNELRQQIHLFHQYTFARGFQVYHQLDRDKQKSRFVDVISQEPENYWQYVRTEADSTNDLITFRTLRNEAGIKGNLLKLFYNGYAAFRNYEVAYNNNIPSPRKDRTGVETFVGGRMSLQLDSLTAVTGTAELMPIEGNYRIEGRIRTKWFEATGRQMRYTPAFAQLNYAGNHHEWAVDFDNPVSTELNGYIHYRSSWLNISPGVTLTRLRNFIFFRQFDFPATEQQIFPSQAANNIYTTPELRLSITMLRHIQLSSRILYTRILENNDNALQIPELMVNTQLSYENIFFNGNLDMHAGVDLHWQSDYTALGYNPAIRQFYVQNTFVNPAFPLVDVFFNAKIKRGRIFIKYNNLLQAFTNSGYLPTPGYPGQRNIIDFGFDWSFYD